VLQIVKEHDSENSYERRVAGQHAMGTNMGNKNHSRAFCRALKKSMHTVITDTIQTVLTTIDPATLRAPAFAAARLAAATRSPGPRTWPGQTDRQTDYSPTEVARSKVAQSPRRQSPDSRHLLTASRPSPRDEQHLRFL
jgi:hypothetical protein